jgi:hypothetical protein
MRFEQSCGERPLQPKLSFFVILSLCTIMMAFVLIGCVLFLFRLRRRKQGPFTLTTLVEPPSGMGSGANRDGNSAGQNHGDGGNSGMGCGGDGRTMSTVSAGQYQMMGGSNPNSSGNMMMNSGGQSSGMHTGGASGQGNAGQMMGSAAANHQAMMMMQAGASQQGQLPAFRMAPMGSAEAEFQNDFIAVFPMHHLEPCPEKNTTAAIMNMEKSYFNG